MVVLLLQGWGMAAELAAMCVSTPRQWVGLAASKPESTPGLAATVEGLTG